MLKAHAEQVQYQPRNTVFDFILQGGLTREVVETVSYLTEGSHWIEDQDSPHVHNIVMGLSMKSLGRGLGLHPEENEAINALGTTPFYGQQHEGIDTPLLSYGVLELTPMP